MSAIKYCAPALLAGLCFFSSVTLSAQGLAAPKHGIKPLAKKARPLTGEISGGLRLNTNGWGLYGEYGNYLSDEGRDREKFYDVRVFSFSLDEIKHPKETKYNNNAQGAGNGVDKPKAYIFGKVNNFYSLKLGYGFRKMIAGKPEPGTVSVYWTYTGGVAIGLEKPYYLNAFVPQDNFGPLIQKDIKYGDDTKSSFLNHNYIVGSSGFGKGLGEIKVVPGLHARTGLHFDFSNRRRLVMALDAGISVEYYTKKVVLLANQDAKPYFVNLFAGMQFGLRR